MSSATLQSLIYALIQLVHNFGAVAVLATAACGIWLARHESPLQRRAAILLALAWAVQVAGGAAFGATSLYFYGHFPDIHGVAIDALFVKIGCATVGFLIAVAYAWLGSKGCCRNSLVVWVLSFTLGAVALSAAAFLRWFS
jgi:hypothetical protein